MLKSVAAADPENKRCCHRGAWPRFFLLYSQPVQCTVQIFSKIQLFTLYWFPLHTFAVLSKQKILVKLSKYISPEFAASVLETNVVATEEHDLDFSFCLMTSLSMFQQLFSLRWLMQQQEKKVYHFVLVGSPGLHK